MVIGSMNFNILQLATGSEFLPCFPFFQGQKEGDALKLGVGHKPFIVFVVFFSIYVCLLDLVIFRSVLVLLFCVNFPNIFLFSVFHTL